MPDNGVPENAVGDLTEVIEALRTQLTAALTAGDGKAIRFRAQTVQLEFEVAVQRNLSASAGVKFWVVSGDGSRSTERTRTHRLTLTLEPVDMMSDDGESPLITKAQPERPH